MAELLIKQASLSDFSQLTLFELEEIVEANYLQASYALFEAGRALREIRNRKLYRQDFPTFENYCREKWSYSRSFVFEIILAWETNELVRFDTYELTSVKQAKALIGLSHEQKQAVFKAAIESGDKLSGTVLKREAERLDYRQPPDPHTEEKLPPSQQTIYDIPIAPDDPQPILTAIAESERQQQQASNWSQSVSTKSDQYKTPQTLIDLVIDFFGAIDCDPCCDDLNDPNVPAHVAYDERRNGLQQDWPGRVYLHPPNDSEIENWIDKLLAEYRAGNCREAIALLPARPDTGWFYKLRHFQWVAIRGRLKSDTIARSLFYVGKRPTRFAKLFSRLGIVWMHDDRCL